MHLLKEMLVMLYEYCILLKKWLEMSAYHFVEVMDSSFLPLVHFGCGMSAGVMASIVTQPADVIKTKMQLFPEKFTSVMDAIAYVHKVITELWGGLGERLHTRFDGLFFCCKPGKYLMVYIFIKEKKNGTCYIAIVVYCT